MEKRRVVISPPSLKLWRDLRRKKKMAMHHEYEWKDRSVFVTGASGLLGGWLVDELVARGASVTVLVRDRLPFSLLATRGLENRVNLVAGDLCDFPSLQRILNEFDINTVFHLGAQAIVGYANRSPLSTFHSNIEGTWNLLEACRLSPWVKKIVVASSDKAYGTPEKLPYTEDMPLLARHPYDVSKSCSDLIAQSYFHTYQLPVCITRCGNIFGGGDLHFNRIVPRTIKLLLQDEQPAIRSNGLLIRDYVYVKDVVHGYLLLAEKMDDQKILGEVFNISEETPLTVIEMVQLIAKVMGKGPVSPKIQGVISGEIPEQYLSCEKARKLLGWKAQWGIEQGLKETHQWYKEFFDNEVNKNYSVNYEKKHSLFDVL